MDFCDFTSHQEVQTQRLSTIYIKGNIKYANYQQLYVTYLHEYQQ